MSPEEIDKAILQISWGGRFIEARDSKGFNHFLIIKPLNIKDKNFVEFVESSARKHALDEGLPSKLELYNGLKERGVWTQEQDIKMETLASKIKDLDMLIESSKGKQVKVLKRKQDKLEDELQSLADERWELFRNTAEAHAEEHKTLAIIFAATRDEQEEKVWHSWRDFLDAADTILVRNILAKFNYGVVTHNVKQIREIARSSEWRFKWNAAKHIGDLFGKPISEFDAEQLALIYWSQVYDSVYESMDRPSDDIINDDELLDKWFEEQSKKDKQKKFEEKGEFGKLKLSSKMRGHGEVFVVANKQINPDAPEVSDVHGLNTELVRKFKQSEEGRIKEAGQLKETELRKRGDRFSRKIIGASDAVISGNSFGKARGGKGASTILPGGSIS